MGSTPCPQKKYDVPLKAYPRLYFQISIQGDSEMQYRFVQKEEFTVIGHKETVMSDGTNFYPKIWDTLAESDYRELSSLGNTDLSGILHISVNNVHFSNEEKAIDYYIAVSTTKPCSEHLVKLTIPRQNWVVFDVSGDMPHALLHTWERVYKEWFPTSRHELAKAPEIVRGEIDGTNLEIWVPVQPLK